jgi:hypothetical protein
MSLAARFSIPLIMSSTIGGVMALIDLDPNAGKTLLSSLLRIAAAYRGASVVFFTSYQAPATF